VAYIILISTRDQRVRVSFQPPSARPTFDLETFLKVSAVILRSAISKPDRANINVNPRMSYWYAETTIKGDSMTHNGFIFEILREDCAHEVQTLSCPGQ
jgi:hypothetical protein